MVTLEMDYTTHSYSCIHCKSTENNCRATEKENEPQQPITLPTPTYCYRTESIVVRSARSSLHSVHRSEFELRVLLSMQLFCSKWSEKKGSRTEYV